jgi:hypothetical protein
MTRRKAKTPPVGTARFSNNNLGSWNAALYTIPLPARKHRAVRRLRHVADELRPDGGLGEQKLRLILQKTPWKENDEK